METLQISKENALKAFDEASDKTKKVLSNLFGDKVFIRKVTDRVKTFEDALEVIGESTEAFSKRTQNDTTDEVAYKQVKVIAQALNEGWIPDWHNSSEYKYYCWFKAVGSGVGFSFYDFVFDLSGSLVGSRLCFKSRELAEYAAKQFQPIYNQLFKF